MFRNQRGNRQVDLLEFKLNEILPLKLDMYNHLIILMHVYSYKIGFYNKIKNRKWLILRIISSDIHQTNFVKKFININYITNQIAVRLVNILKVH